VKEQIQTESIKDILEETPFNNYNIEEVNEGVSTNVFKLEDTETYYLKIPPNRDFLEATVLANKLLLQEGINVPEIVYSKEDSKNFYIEKELKGRSLKKDSTLSEEQKNEIVIEAGKDLARINSIPVNGIGWIEGVRNGQLFSNSRNYNDYVLRNNGNILNDLLQINVLSNEQAEKIAKYIIEHQTLLDTEGVSNLAHGDFCTEHIYHINGKYSGIIDFGDIRGTSKYHDLAHFYTYDRKYFDSLVKGYNSVYQLHSDYIDKVLLEAVVFGVRKLWWISKNMPNKLNNHLALDLFREVVY
jgi:aminoglycoside phosphotransferase (APT) family kinase protein